jgi:hypothetical protein
MLRCQRKCCDAKGIPNCNAVHAALWFVAYNVIKPTSLRDNTSAPRQLNRQAPPLMEECVAAGY